jgi:hypothetical protein
MDLNALRGVANPVSYSLALEFGWCFFACGRNLRPNGGVISWPKQNGVSKANG